MRKKKLLDMINKQNETIRNLDKRIDILNEDFIYITYLQNTNFVGELKDSKLIKDFMSTKMKAVGNPIYRNREMAEQPSSHTTTVRSAIKDIKRGRLAELAEVYKILVDFEFKQIILDKYKKESKNGNN